MVLIIAVPSSFNDPSTACSCMTLEYEATASLSRTRKVNFVNEFGPRPFSIAYSFGVRLPTVRWISDSIPGDRLSSGKVVFICCAVLPVMIRLTTMHSTQQGRVAESTDAIAPPIVLLLLLLLLVDGGDSSLTF